MVNSAQPASASVMRMSRSPKIRWIRLDSPGKNHSAQARQDPLHRRAGDAGETSVIPDNRRNIAGLLLFIEDLRVFGDPSGAQTASGPWS